MKYGVEHFMRMGNNRGHCTVEYAKMMGLKEVPGYLEVKEGECCRCFTFGTDKGRRWIWTTQGKVIMFQYGEYTLFDSEAERDAYRAEQSAVRAELIRKNRAIKALNQYLLTKTAEELEALVANLPR